MDLLYLGPDRLELIRDRRFLQPLSQARDVERAELKSLAGSGEPFAQSIRRVEGSLGQGWRLMVVCTAAHPL